MRQSVWLNEWLVRHAREAQASGSAKTYIVAEGNRVTGYFSLMAGQIDALEAPDRRATIRYRWSYGSFRRSSMGTLIGLMMLVS